MGGHAGVESAAPLLVGGAEVEPPVAWAEVGDEGVVDGVDCIDGEAFGVGGGVLQVYHAAFGHEIDHGSGYCAASAAGGEQEYVAREAAGQEAYFSEGVHREGVVACAAVVNDYLPEFRGVGGAVYCYAVALHAQGGAPHEAPLCPFGEGHNGGKVTGRHLRSGAEHGVDLGGRRIIQTTTRMYFQLTDQREKDIFLGSAIRKNYESEIAGIDRRASQSLSIV